MAVLATRFAHDLCHTGGVVERDNMSCYSGTLSVAPDGTYSFQRKHKAAVVEVRAMAGAALTLPDC